MCTQKRQIFAKLCSLPPYAWMFLAQLGPVHGTSAVHLNSETAVMSSLPPEELTIRKS